MRLIGLCAVLAFSVLAAQPAQAQAPAASAPQQLFVIIYRAGPAWKPGLPATQQPLAHHGAYVRKLASEGTLIAGGPFGDADGGLGLLRAPDAAAARAILAADPAITEGVMTGELRAWTPFVGTGEAVPMPGVARPSPKP
jgi:uncharacterized protein YciI